MNGDSIRHLGAALPEGGAVPLRVSPLPRPPPLQQQQQPRQLHINFLVNQLHPNQLDDGYTSKRLPIAPQFNQWLEPQAAGGVEGGLLPQWFSHRIRAANGGVGVAAASVAASPSASVASITGLIATTKQRAGKKYELLQLLAAISLLEGALLIGLIVFTYFYMKSAGRQASICQSRECVRAASSLLRSMDRSVSPCEDFYQYTCGRWSEDHPPPAAAFSHDWFYDRREHVLLAVREFLQRNSTEDEPWAVQQARVLYEACLDRDAWESLGLEPMLSALEAAGLPRRPPLVANASWNWVRTAVLSQRHINKDLLVNVDVVPDVRNRSINRIFVRKYRSGSPLLGFLGRRLEDRRHRILARASLEQDAEDGEDADVDGEQESKDDERHITAYMSYMTSTMDILMKVNETSTPQSSRGSVRPDAGAVAGCSPRAPLPSHVTRAARKVLEFNKALYNLAFPENRTHGKDGEPEEMWVWELQKLTDVEKVNETTPQMNWTEYLTLMFENVPNVTLDLTKDKIVVGDDDYLKELSQLLARTPIETLQLSLWWELVDLLAPYTTSEMRLLRRRYQEIASGTSAARTRESICTEAVNSLMGMAVSFHLANPMYLRTTGEKVQEMLGDVKHVFEELVDELDWMDSPTKKNTLEKVRAMRSFIGFPEWLLRAKDLDSYYEGLNMTRDAFLHDLLSFQQLVTLSTLSTLRQVTNDSGWATDPTDVNAFHTFQANSVTIPAGILQFPFYDLGLEALNYGAIGSILGHELTHGFDSYGRLFDSDGNMRSWWSNATVAEYENRTACFVRQYGDYFLPEVEMNVDGELTLGENIADNGGLHESIRAYRRYIARHGDVEPLLPGMANYTHEQLLFLSYVHVWCESWTKESLRWGLEDEHAPNRVRTWGVLSNSEDFARAWGCSKGTAMNPDRHRCRLW